MRTNDEGEYSEKSVRHRFIKWAFVLIILWLVWPIFARFSLWLQNELWPVGVDDTKLGWAEIGQSGDMFGPLNTLFAGFGFVALVMTLLLQMKDTRETRREVQLNIRTAKDQQFEASFFQLLNTFNNQVGEFTGIERAPMGMITVKGREFIRDEVRNLNHELESWLFDCKRNNIDPATQDYGKVAYVKYMAFYGARDYYLASYFRFIYRILLWIERSDQEDKWFYVKIVRAQLSPQEVFVLMFNCVGAYGENMKTLVEKYALLKHVALESHFLVFKKLFKDSAFTDPEDRKLTGDNASPAGVPPEKEDKDEKDVVMAPAEKIVQLRETEKSIADVIKFADQKASIFITLNLGLLGLAISNDAFTSLSGWLSVFIISWLIGILLLFCVVYPWGFLFYRQGRSYYDPVGIKDWSSLGYVSAMKSTIKSVDMIADLAGIVHHRAKTSNRKYWLLSFGLGLSVMGFLGVLAVKFPRLL